ncbi:MAG: futalosine hydrolase [Bacteroidales bacterium]
MRILIVSATTLEIKPLIKHFTFEERVDAHMNRYSFNKLTLDVLTTGVGMVPTAYLMGKALMRHHYDAALNLGIAGCFDRNLELGEVVHITHDQFPELGSEQGEYFLSLIDLKLLEENYFPYKDGQLVNEMPLKSKTINNLRTVRSITVNRVHTTNKSIEKIRQRCNPATESMEGAAFLFACLAEDIPCAQIRSISNYVENHDTDRWSIPKAIENLNKVILQVLLE